MLALLAAPLLAQNLPPLAPADRRDAEAAYQFHCAFCHGRGDDGFAANLVTPRLPHAPTDSSLVAIIRNGIQGTDMPPALGMSDREIRLVAQYVRELGRKPPEKVPGDARRGEQIYLGKGTCATCHMVRGQGGRLGPDLTDIGARRSAVNLRTSLVDPDASLTPGFASVTVTLTGGKRIEGIRVNENTFSIQVRDADGRFHHLRKTEIANIDRSAKSTMPSYKTLSAAELDDLVAYLSSLRGAS
jgi:putative heme-binding domain-containing protein